MIICPLCQTSDLNKFIGSAIINTYLPSKLIRTSLRCTYCGHDFYVETDLNWKTSIDTAKVRIPNLEYTVIATTWYKDEKGTEFVLSPGSILTLQGFELSTHSNFSPFKTASGSIIRLHNNRVKRI